MSRRLGCFVRALLCVIAMSSAAPGDALADDPPRPPPDADSLGFIGLPERTAAGTDLLFFTSYGAREAAIMIRLADKAVQECKREDFDYFKAQILAAKETLRGWSEQKPSGFTPLHQRQMRADMDQLDRVYERMGTFDRRREQCAREAIDRVMEFFMQGGFSIPWLISSSITSNEPGFPSQTASASSSYGLPNFGAGVRLNVVRVNPTIYVETRFQTAFGSTAFSQTFAQPTFGTAPFGQNTIRENWGIPILLGASVPLGRLGNTPLGADFYGGITISNWTHSLQGGEAAVAGGGPGFGTQQTRTSVDPTFGVGLRAPSLDIDGDGRGDLIVGLYAEFAFRQASTVTAASTAFPGVTYSGTADAHTNTSLMLRVGIPFGRPVPLFWRN